MPNSDTSWAGRDLRDLDLREFDLSDKALFQTDLRGAKLYGAKVALTCGQFDSVRLDTTQASYLLLMIAQADMDPLLQSGLRDLVRSVIGEQSYRALMRLMKVT